MEIMPTTRGIDDLRKNLRRWMRPRARHVAFQYWRLVFCMESPSGPTSAVQHDN